MLTADLIFAVLTFIASFVVALFVFFQNFRNRKNISFAIVSIFISFWLFCSTFANYSRVEDIALIWSRLAMIGPPIAIAMVLYFSLIFPRQKNKVEWYKIFLIFFPVIIMEALVPTKYNIKSVKIENWGTSYEPGFLFDVLLVMIIVYISLALFILFKKYYKENTIARMQIKYFMLGLGLLALIGSSTNVVFPIIMHDTRASVVGPSLAILAFNGFIAYAIVRYRLLDVRILIQETFISLINFSFMILVYASLVYVLKNLSTLTIEHVSIVSAIGAMFIFIGLIKHINGFLKKITNKILFENQYNFSEVVESLNKTISQRLDLEKMLDESFEILINTLGIEKITFLLYDESLGKFISKKSLGFPKNIKLELGKDNALYKYLKQRKDTTIAEELEIRLDDNLIRGREAVMVKKVVKQFKNWGVYICQPIVKNKAILGIVCIDEKKSGNPFRDDDLKLVHTFANQIVLVIENFIVFNEIKTKKEQLEKSMGLMVGRELKMMELKKEIKKLRAQLSN